MLFSTLKVSLPGSLLSLNLKGFDTTESVTFICKEVGLAIFLFLAFQTILRWSSITIFNKLGLIVPSLIINLLSAAKELSVTFIWSFCPLTFIFLTNASLWSGKRRSRIFIGGRKFHWLLGLQISTDKPDTSEMKQGAYKSACSCFPPKQYSKIHNPSNKDWLKCER